MASSSIVLPSRHGERVARLDLELVAAEVREHAVAVTAELQQHLQRVIARRDRAAEDRESASARRARRCRPACCTAPRRRARTALAVSWNAVLMSFLNRISARAPPTPPDRIVSLKAGSDACGCGGSAPSARRCAARDRAAARRRSRRRVPSPAAGRARRGPSACARRGGGRPWRLGGRTERSRSGRLLVVGWLGASAAAGFLVAGRCRRFLVGAFFAVAACTAAAPPAAVLSERGRRPAAQRRSKVASNPLKRRAGRPLRVIL